MKGSFSVQVFYGPKAVIGPALQFNFALCPLLPSSPSLQVLIPMELFNECFAY